MVKNAAATILTKSKFDEITPILASLYWLKSYFNPLGI